MKLAVLGPPGAGKGTQAELLAKTFAIPRISMGELLRELGRERSELGKRVKRTLVKGELVPDDLVLTLLKERLRKSDTKKGFVLDGIPRTLKQAQEFHKLFSLDKIFVLKIGEKTATARLLKRGREDDTPEAIKKRFAIFNRGVGKIIELYRSSRVLEESDAGDRPRVVHQRILSRLKQD